MTTEYLMPFSEQEWLDWRKQDLTSTDIASLFDLSPYATKFETWHNKKSGESNAFNDNERMQAGRHIEPAIASLFGERFKITASPYKTYARDTAARLGSSFDYRITDATESTDSEIRRLYMTHGIGILEIKNVDFLVHRDKWTPDECPDHIEIQLQHQLELTDTNWGVVVALVGGNKLWVYIRERDLAVGRAIRKAAAEFWASIEADTPPDPVFPDDAEAIIAMYQYAEPGKILDARDDTDMQDLADRYRALGVQASAIDDERTTIKAKLLEAAGTASKVILPGGSLSLSQTADSPPTVITAEMIGQTYGGRKGYRSMRYTPAKAPK